MSVTDLHWYHFCEPITEFSAIPWCHHRFGVKGPWSLHGILWDQVATITRWSSGWTKRAGQGHQYLLESHHSDFVSLIDYSFLLLQVLWARIFHRSIDVESIIQCISVAQPSLKQHSAIKKKASLGCDPKFIVSPIEHLHFNKEYSYLKDWQCVMFSKVFHWIIMEKVHVTLIFHIKYSIFSSSHP